MEPLFYLYNGFGEACLTSWYLHVKVEHMLTHMEVHDEY